MKLYILLKTIYRKQIDAICIKKKYIYVLSYVAVRFISLYLIGDFIRTRGMHLAVLYRSANKQYLVEFYDMQK